MVDENKLEHEEVDEAGSERDPSSGRSFDKGVEIDLDPITGQ